jgi:hypothetical protein
MKKIKMLVIIFITVVLVVTIFYLNKSNIKINKIIYTEVAVSDTCINFGILNLNIPKDTCFFVKNIGEEALIIQHVETSCGCTVPVWTETPIATGEQGEIKVTYDSKYPGHFYKTISVYANVQDIPILLYIKGEVPYSSPEVN